MNTKRAVGVIAGCACLAFALLVACLPRDDLSTHSRDRGIEANGGGGSARTSALARDAGNDSSAGGSSGSSSQESDAASTDAPAPRDGG